MQEGKDYYITPAGLLVFTAHYLRERATAAVMVALTAPMITNRWLNPAVRNS